MTEIKVASLEDVKFPESSFTISKSACDDLIVVFERNGQKVHLYLWYDKHEDVTRLHVDHARKADDGELTITTKNIH